MVLFTIFMILLVLCLMYIGVVAIVGGGVFILAYADVIVCVVIIVFLVRFIIKKFKK